MNRPAGNLSVQRRHLLGNVYKQLLVILLLVVIIVWAVIVQNVIAILIAFAVALLMGLTNRHIYRCPACNQSLWASLKNQIPAPGTKVPFQLHLMDALKNGTPLRCEHCGKFIDHVHE